jgi:hypothetical protein
MKLRFPFHLQQLLSATTVAFVLGTVAHAQDTVTMATGTVTQGKVLGVTPSGNLELQVAGSTDRLGFPLSSVRDVKMAPPPEYAQAYAAYTAKDYAKSLTLMKTVVDKFKGLPSAWAQQAALMMGELYIQSNDLPKAEAAANDFKRLYPTSGGLQAEVLFARIAAAKNDMATAKQKLAPITEAALKEKTVNVTNGLAYSQAFLVSGQVKEADGDLPGALEDYLRTVTIFYLDKSAVASAQDRANALREAHKDVVVP